MSSSRNDFENYTRQSNCWFCIMAVENEKLAYNLKFRENKKQLHAELAENLKLINFETIKVSYPYPYPYAYPSNQITKPFFLVYL